MTAASTMSKPSWVEVILFIFIQYTKRERYQSTKKSPASSARNVPAIKKGPNGTLEPRCFFFKSMRETPTAAPARNAKNKATNILGQPRNKPMNSTSFASPMPIHVSFEARTRARKNRAGTAPSAREKSKAPAFHDSSALQANTRASAGYKTLSGMR